MSENITVVKFGSELVANGVGVEQSRINDYASGLVETYGADGLIVVTSGAVASGKARVQQAGERLEDYSDVTLAQLGCASVMRAWEAAFERAGVMAGGLLTTHHEIEDLEEGPSLVRAINAARRNRVISVINENDAMSNRELIELAYGGDNDGLASHIARAVGADALMLFSTMGGVFDDDGELIERVDQTNIEQVRDIAIERAPGKDGRGGLVTKVNSAYEAAEAGIASQITGVNADMTGENSTSFVVG